MEHGLFIVSAPSGAGKTSLVQALVEKSEAVGVVVSHTTRPIRDGEVNGVNYHFETRANFEAMIAAGEFVEHAEVFGNLYGTSRAAVETVVTGGQHAILEIDWQGAAQVRRASTKARSIFILPTSIEELRRRLMRRGQDDQTTIEHRMGDAKTEMSHYHEFDYVVVNDNFDDALAELQSIAAGAGEGLRLDARRTYLAPLLEDLLAT